MMEWRGWPKLGIPLARRGLDARGARPELELADVGGEAVEAVVLERASDALDVFFCNVDAVGRDMDWRDGFLRSCWSLDMLDMAEIDGFLRSWSVDAGARSCETLPEGLSTGSRDGAGRGMPDGRETGEDSMVLRAIRCYA